jgi:predicted permease
MNKKGAISIATVEAWIIGIILVIIAVIVIFQLVGNTGASIVTAAGNASASGLPLAGVFFGANGIVLLIFVIVIAMVMIVGLFRMLSQKK